MCKFDHAASWKTSFSAIYFLAGLKINLIWNSILNCAFEIKQLHWCNFFRSFEFILTLMHDMLNLYDCVNKCSVIFDGNLLIMLFLVDCGIIYFCILSTMLYNLRSNVLTWNVILMLYFCDWAIWKNRGILKFSSEYGPSIKKK